MWQLCFCPGSIFPPITTASFTQQKFTAAFSHCFHPLFVLEAKQYATSTKCVCYQTSKDMAVQQRKD